MWLQAQCDGSGVSTIGFRYLRDEQRSRIEFDGGIKEDVEDHATHNGDAHNPQSPQSSGCALPNGGLFNRRRGTRRR